jgi:hypothetical protein
MPQKVYHVQLSNRDRQQLQNYVTHGQRAARAVTRARILLLADEDYGDEEIMEVLEAVDKFLKRADSTTSGSC